MGRVIAGVVLGAVLGGILVGIAAGGIIGAIAGGTPANPNRKPVPFWLLIILIIFSLILGIVALYLLARPGIA